MNPGPRGRRRTAGHEREERKVGVVSGTPADTFDETAERKHDKWIAIYISVLAVLIAISLTGSNDAMKIAQQAGIQVNDNYAFYQAKTIRKQQIQIASDQLELKTLGVSPEVCRRPASSWTPRRSNTTRKMTAEFNPKKGNGRKELLAKAESCDNLRNIALAQHPFYDYSGAMLQIAIVLASASIITGARLLLGVSGGVGLFGNPAVLERLCPRLRLAKPELRQARSFAESLAADAPLRGHKDREMPY